MGQTRRFKFNPCRIAALRQGALLYEARNGLSSSYSINFAKLMVGDYPHLLLSVKRTCACRFRLLNRAFQ